MLRSTVAAAVVGSAAAFAPAALPTTGRTNAARASVTMQAKSASVPFLDEPARAEELKKLPGYVGFDPLGFSTLGNIAFLREAEVKHGRVAMLAAGGAIAQDLFQFPGVTSVIGDAKMTGVHDKLIALNQAGNNQAAAMTQILFWVGFLEFCTFPAIYETMNGGTRAPGDFMFDPLGMGKKDMETMALKEIKNGRAAMIGVGGMVHHYLLTGKGPLAFLTGIPNYKSCIEPHIPSLCQ